MAKFFLNYKYDRIKDNHVNWKVPGSIPHPG